MTLLIAVVALVWLAQRVLAAKQAMAFRQVCVQLRASGLNVCVGVASRFGRRVYVALGADDSGCVAAARVMRGVTVLARAHDEPDLAGRRIAELSADPSLPGLPPLVVEAARQAAVELSQDHRSQPARAASARSRTATRQK